jgi:hypothetical protein
MKRQEGLLKSDVKGYGAYIIYYVKDIPVFISTIIWFLD